MADDGFTLAGIAWQEAGQADRARPLWEQQVERYPQGDLAPEGFWRLAWTAYLRGDTQEAIEAYQELIKLSPLAFFAREALALLYEKRASTLHACAPAAGPDAMPPPPHEQPPLPARSPAAPPGE